MVGKNGTGAFPGPRPFVTVWAAASGRAWAAGERGPAEHGHFAGAGGGPQ